MTDDMQGLKDDLAFLRAVAADGGRSPPQGGVILASAGFLFGAASLGAWAILDGRTGLAPSAVWLPWTVASVVFYAILFLAMRALRRAGPKGPVARLAGVAWGALGGAWFSILLGYAVVSTLEDDGRFWATAPTVLVACYGAGWLTAGAASGTRWMAWVAYVSWAAAVGLAFCTQSNLIWLAYAAVLVLLTGVPGLVLMRRSTAA